MITLSLIKKWLKMFSHKSVFHVNQKEGSFYSIEELKGYYNDLRDKVLFTELYDENGIPYNYASSGEEKIKVYFPITIFQYGLGAYDKFLETNDNVYLQKMFLMANWALNMQNENGSWNAFGMLNYSCAYSSMAQGEGASLLARAYKETSDEKYKIACVKAIDFMLLPLEKGGTANYNDGIKLYEYPASSLVLNGWIFSSFGLIDCYKITKKEEYKQIFYDTLKTIEGNLYKFDAKVWSYYDLEHKFTSPFYHELHVELLKVCTKFYPSEEFNKYIELWNTYFHKKLYRKIAILRKGIQKILEKKSNKYILVG